jgi:tetratricopeptide (TPR) repeat protein
VLLALLLVIAAVAAYWFGWRTPAVPAIPADGLDAEVATAIAGARADVLARPRSAAAWGGLGMVLFAQNLYAESLAFLAEAQRLDPADARWPYLRGLALIHTEPNDGIRWLEHAASLPPPDFAVRLRLAEEYLKLQRIDEADEHFAELLARHPDNPRVLLGRGQVLAWRGRWQEALAPLHAAADHPTARRSAPVALAEVYGRLGNVVAAEDQRRRAEDAGPEVLWPDLILTEVRALRTGLQPRIDETVALLGEGRIADAQALIQHVLRDHPKSDEAHLTLAKVLIHAQRFDDAAAELRRAIDLNPKLVEGHFLLGGTQMVRKDYTAAEASYLRAAQLKPSYGVAHYNVGDCRLKLGKQSAAIDAFRDAVRSRPDLAVAHVELGALLLQDGRFDEAIAHLEQAVHLDARNDRARRLLEQARAKKTPE